MPAHRLCSLLPMAHFALTEHLRLSTDYVSVRETVTKFGFFLVELDRLCFLFCLFLLILLCEINDGIILLQLPQYFTFFCLLIQTRAISYLIFIAVTAKYKRNMDSGNVSKMIALISIN